MSKLAGLANGPALGTAGIVAAAVVGVVLYVSGVFEPAQDPVVQDPVTQDPVTQDAVVQDAVVQDPVAEADTPVDATPDASPETAEVPAVENDIATETPLPDPPSIDTFRLEPDGTMLVAGQAHPDWQTWVVVDGALLEQVSLDAQGKFVSFLTIDSSDQPRILSLKMRDEENNQTVESIDEIIIAPVVAEVALTETVEPAEQAETAESVETQADDPIEQPDTTTAAQAVLLSDETGVQVLQPAVSSDQPPEVMSSVALDAISYSPAGEVQLAGRGQGDGFVRVYLDNAPITTLPIQEDGNWRTDLPQVDTGVYTLRIDEVDGEGNVTSRVETPFKREDQTVIADSVTPETRITAITVQPGSTLWAISRERYGDGVLYVRVFEANRDRIRNPDLIYPGQVFTLPE